MGILDAANDGHDTVILDDGFQDYKIKRRISYVLIAIGKLVMAMFFLLAFEGKFNTVKNAQIIVINGHKIPDFERKVLDINPKIIFFYYSEYKIKNINEFKNKNYSPLQVFEI